MAIPALVVLLVICIYTIIRRVSPHKIKKTMQNQGIRGPDPQFLVGNLLVVRKIIQKAAKLEFTGVSHNIEHRLFPHLVQWRRIYGKKFVYWVGTEAVLYIQEPELVNDMSFSGSFNWGRPSFLKEDRYPLFGNGLIMAEAEDWIHQRRMVGQAFTPDKLKGLFTTVVGSMLPILDDWGEKIIAGGGSVELEVDGELNKVTSEVISKLLFGSSYNKGFHILQKLRTLQEAIFKSNRLVGVPGSRFIPTSGNRQTWKVAKEADVLIMEIIKARRSERRSGFNGDDGLLGLLLSEFKDTRDVIDQCKTLLIAGQETTKLSLTWTMMLLALNPQWQDRVRAEVMEITRGGADPLNINMLAKLKTMTMVLKESMRLYPPVAYTVRQAKQEMKVGGIAIPKGMSVVIDILGMHEDPDIWGHDVYEFNPQRFSASNRDRYSKRNGGFVPFGFGERMCAGERLATMKQKVILCMILSRFAFSVSPNYIHSPTSLLSIMPSHGMRLLFQKLRPNMIIKGKEGI